MSLDNVKSRLYDLTARFFNTAEVLWAEQVNTQPPLPYVTLKLGSIRRRLHPVDDPNPCYHCETVAEINLYTEGRKIPASGNVTGNYVNTATEDLLAFVNYMSSPGVTDALAYPPIAVTLKGDVRDLTFLENDRQHRYRAMAEFDVSFVLEADGWYSVLGNGGVPAELASEVVEIIEEAEVEEIE